MRTKTLYEAMKGVQLIISSTSERTDDENVIGLCSTFEKAILEYELEQMKNRIRRHQK